MSKHTGAYKTFFESPAGLELLTNIKALRDSNHQKAEDKPELARDYMQRAKGNQEAVEQINIVLNGGVVIPSQGTKN